MPGLFIFIRPKNAWLLLLLIPCNSYSQKKKIQNMPSYDLEILHFGFQLGYNYAGFVSVPAENFHAVDTVYNITPNSIGGFDVHILTNLRLFDNLDLRFKPGLSFVQRDLNYTLHPKGSASSVLVKKSVESNFVEFPIELKFKSNRINNYRIFVTGGFKYNLDLASRKSDRNSQDKQPLKIDKIDYGYEIGGGIDLYLTYVKLSPEIKMFTGMKNLLITDEYLYSRTLDKLYSKIFSFSLTLESL